MTLTSQVAEMGYPLSRTNTFTRPPGDPGVRFPLSPTDSSKDCFEKFHPYLMWLRDFIQANNTWLPEDIGPQYSELYTNYTIHETECGRIGAIKEFFSQKAHGRVLRLWNTYKTLRRRVDDMGTKRVTMRTAEIASQNAQQHFLADLAAEQLENADGAEGLATPLVLQAFPLPNVDPSTSFAGGSYGEVSGSTSVAVVA
ncbi:hypothetical protein FRB90_005061 [Tulasnella sp. 427]|nr:hypothetical protein FRB90_005061 [Tulasnella sp. 427]